MGFSGRLLAMDANPLLSHIIYLSPSCIRIALAYYLYYPGIATVSAYCYRLANLSTYVPYPMCVFGHPGS